MHPDYLRSMKVNQVILAIPIVNLKNIVTLKNQQNVRIDTYLGNVNTGYTYYDISSGLATLAVSQIPGGPAPLVTIYRLVQ